MAAVTYSFTVFGPPVGYTIQLGRFRFNKRKVKYIEYKKLIQEKCPFALPLVATKERPVHIETNSFFVNGIHPDPENVHKGVKDALFYVAKGKSSKDGKKVKGSGDKYTGGMYHPPAYDKENPRVEIFITVEQ